MVGRQSTQWGTRWMCPQAQSRAGEVAAQLAPGGPIAASSCSQATAGDGGLRMACGPAGQLDRPCKQADVRGQVRTSPPALRRVAGVVTTSRVATAAYWLAHGRRSGLLALLPLFDSLQQLLLLFVAGPDRISPFQRHFMATFELAVVSAAEVWSRGDPQHAVERDVLVVDATEDRHFVVVSGGGWAGGRDQRDVAAGTARGGLELSSGGAAARL